MTTKPKTSQKMGAAAREALISLVEKAYDDVVDGANPSEALAKYAMELNIPKGHLDLAAHAYNVERTNAQRELGATPAEKAASFELADVDRIRELIYGQVKQAEDTTVSDDYSAPPSVVLAAPIKEAHIPYEVPFKERDGAYYYHRFQKDQAKVGEFKADIEADRQKIAEHIEALEKYYRNSQAVDFDSSREICEAYYGKSAAWVFNVLKQRVPESCQKLKTAYVVKKHDPAKAPFSTLQEIHKIAMDVIEKEQHYNTLVDTLNSFYNEKLADYVVVVDNTQNMLFAEELEKEARQIDITKPFSMVRYIEPSDTLSQKHAKAYLNTLNPEIARWAK